MSVKAARIVLKEKQQDILLKFTQSKTVSQRLMQRAMIVLLAFERRRNDAASGQRTVVVPSERLVVPGSSRPLKLSWFQRASSGNRLLLHGEVTEGARSHWLYEPESGALRPLDEGPGLLFDTNAFSSDGERLRATRGADLVVLDIASGRTIPLTNDGAPDAIENGHRANWSPDGIWIAYNAVCP